MSRYWTYSAQRTRPIVGYLVSKDNKAHLLALGNLEKQTQSVRVDEDISLTNPMWRDRIIDNSFTWVVPYTARYTVTITGTGGNQEVRYMEFTKGEVIHGSLGSAYEEVEEENPDNIDAPFIETEPATDTQFSDVVVHPLHDEDDSNGHIRIQYEGTVSIEAKHCYIPADVGPLETVKLIITSRDGLGDYIDNEGTIYASLPIGVTEHDAKVRYVETEEVYIFTSVGATTWTPPKEGRVRVLIEAGQNYKNYSDNLNGERIVVDMDVTRKAYTLIVGKNGNWDHDADRYKPGISQFGDSIAHVGSSYPVLPDRHNQLKGYIQITYLRKEKQYGE